MKVINIVDKSKADELVAKGFHYSEVNVKNKMVYQFVETPELLNFLNGRFSKQDFFISKKLCL